MAISEEQRKFVATYTAKPFPRLIIGTREGEIEKMHDDGETEESLAAFASRAIFVNCDATQGVEQESGEEGYLQSFFERYLPQARHGEEYFFTKEKEKYPPVDIPAEIAYNAKGKNAAG